MKNLTKLMLATAILATSGFAESEDIHVISGIQTMNEGASVIVDSKNVKVTNTGKIVLSGSDTDGEGSVLKIESGMALTLEGGELSCAEVKNYGPVVELNGTLELKKGADGNYPKLDLVNVKLKQGMRDQLALNLSSAGGASDFRAYLDELTEGLVCGIPMCEISFEYSAMGQTNVKSENVFVLGEKVYGLTYVYQKIENGFEKTELLGVECYYRSTDDIYIIGDKNEHGYYEGYSVKGAVTKVERDTGELDLCDLNELSYDDISSVDLTDYIKNINPESVSSVKLPFNCTFTNVDLSNASNVSFDKLIVKGAVHPGLVDNVIQKKQKTM